MKRSVAGLAILAAYVSMGSMHAMAQNVTLYGLVDDGITFSNNEGGNRVWRMVSGVSAGSRWGMLGTEDLGGGLSAEFRLESGFDVTNGKLGSGLEFSRMAYVGVSDTKLGTLRLGRQWDTMFDTVENFTINGRLPGGGWYFAHPQDMDNTDNGFPINNAIKYISPNLSGLTIEALYAPGGQPGQFSKNQIWSAGALYARGAFSASVNYFSYNNPAQSTQGYVSGGGYVNSVYGDALAAAKRQSVFAAGAAYKFGDLTITGDITNTIFVGGSQTKSVTFQNYEIAALYQTTPALLLGAGYTYTAGKDNGLDRSPKYHQVNLVANYALSKRTSLYAMGIYQRAAGDAEIAQITGFNPSSGKNQIAVHAGLRVLF